MNTIQSTQNRTVSKRSYLTAGEVDKLAECARKGSRYGLRDSLMITMAYRHGFRAVEITALEWNQIDFDAHRLHVVRAKNGEPSVHPLNGEEVRALKALQRDTKSTGFVFISERGAPMTPDSFLKLVKRLGESAELSFPIHPHMLRHACGYELANKGVDTRALQMYLGHKNMQNTVRYTKLAVDRFKGWNNLL